MMKRYTYYWRGIIIIIETWCVVYMHISNTKTCARLGDELSGLLFIIPMFPNNSA